MAYLYIGDQKVSPILMRDYQVVTISGAVPVINLANYTIYNTEESALTSLTIVNPSPIPTDFVAQINFTSGATATVLNSTNIDWFGDNVSDTQGPILRENCNYAIVFYYTGSKLRGIIQGSSIS